jgi:hypothetical protein
MLNSLYGRLLLQDLSQALDVVDAALKDSIRKLSSFDKYKAEVFSGIWTGLQCTKILSFGVKTSPSLKKMTTRFVADPCDLCFLGQAIFWGVAIKKIPEHSEYPQAFEKCNL